MGRLLLAPTDNLKCNGIKQLAAPLRKNRPVKMDVHLFGALTAPIKIHIKQNILGESGDKDGQTERMRDKREKKQNKG